MKLINLELRNMEIWKQLKNYPDYEVSNLGNVKSLKFNKERILKALNDGNGYLTVSLSKNGKEKRKKIHQLVAMAFLNHIPNYNSIVVDHVNNIPTDNRLENLQLISYRENSSKDRKNGTSKYIGVAWRKDVKKWRSAIYIKGKHKHLGVFNSEIEASKAYQEALKKHLNDSL